jgi:hypothetical protein
VIAVVMGEAQISDIGRGVADRGELREQRAIDRVVIELLGRDAILKGAVGDLAGVPHQGSTRVSDQEAGRDHSCVGYLVRLEAIVVDVGGRNDAAVENIEAQRLRGLRLLLRVGQWRTEGREHSGRQHGGHGTNRHEVLQISPLKRAFAAAAANGNGNRGFCLSRSKRCLHRYNVA